MSRSNGKVRADGKLLAFSKRQRQRAQRKAPSSTGFLQTNIIYWPKVAVVLKGMGVDPDEFVKRYAQAPKHSSLEARTGVSRERLNAAKAFMRHRDVERLRKASGHRTKEGAMLLVARCIQLGLV